MSDADTEFAKQGVREASGRPAPAPTVPGTVSRAGFCRVEGQMCCSAAPFVAGS